MPELALLLGVDGDWLNPEILIPSLLPPSLGMEGRRWLKFESGRGSNPAGLEELSCFMRFKPTTGAEVEENDNVDEDEEPEEKAEEDEECDDASLGDGRNAGERDDDEDEELEEKTEEEEEDDDELPDDESYDGETDLLRFVLEE
jgi:hypothetical protein